jgi:hypothetical protein
MTIQYNEHPRRSKFSTKRSPARTPPDYESIHRTIRRLHFTLRDVLRAMLHAPPQPVAHAASQHGTSFPLQGSIDVAGGWSRAGSRTGPNDDRPARERGVLAGAGPRAASCAGRGGRGGRGRLARACVGLECACTLLRGCDGLDGGCGCGTFRGLAL